MRWPRPNTHVATAYNPADVTGGLMEYYQLLTQAAYFTPSAVDVPPPEGWSDAQLDVDLLRTFGRSDAVIDLLRHLPYIHPNQAGEWQIAPETYAVRYLRGPHSAGWQEDYRRARWAPVMPMEHLPPHMVALATGHCGSTAWLVDTNEGLLYAVGGHIEVPDHDEDKPWTAALGYPVRDFFALARDDILDLTNIPSPVSYKSPAPEIASFDGRLPRRMRRAYTANGWPNLSVFNRDACAARLIQLRRDEESGNLSDATVPDDDKMAVDEDDEDDDDDDGDYELQERDSSGSEDDSDDEDVGLDDLPTATQKVPQEAIEIKEELKFLNHERSVGNNGHLHRAAVLQHTPKDEPMDMA